MKVIQLKTVDLRNFGGDGLNANKRETYKNYLLSEKWWQKRKSIKSCKCFICGSKEQLNLHHLTYARIFKEKKCDLIYLCQTHHNGFHKFAGKKTNIKAVKKYKRFLYGFI